MKVTVKCGTEEGAGGGLGVKCSAAERRVTVERGDGANRKIVFSSTFDAVVDASGEEVEGDEELFATSLAPAVAAASARKHPLGARAAQLTHNRPLAASQWAQAAQVPAASAAVAMGAAGPAARARAAADAAKE